MEDEKEGSSVAIHVGVPETQQNQDIVNKLATGLLEIYKPGLEQVKKQLDELTKKQTTIIDQLGIENKKLSYLEQRGALEEMHAKIETYMTKLIAVKKDMHQTAEKISHLKKRALWLQAAKQKEALQLEYQKELRLQREQELIAKPTMAGNSSLSPS